jgi:VanZ family protein
MTSTTPQKADAATLWRVLLAGYWFALVVGTHLPPTLGTLPGDRGDKLAHFVAYAALAWLLAMAWQSSAGRLNFRHLRWAWLAILLVAVADEVTQPPFGRDASAWDWLVDALGSATGLFVFTLTRRLFETA